MIKEPLVFYFPRAGFVDIIHEQGYITSAQSVKYSPFTAIYG